MFAHHLELGPSPSDFIFPSILGPFLRSEEEIGNSRELVDIKKMILWILSVLSSRSRTAVPITLVLISPPIPLNYVSSPFSRGVVLCVYIKVGIDGVSES